MTYYLIIYLLFGLAVGSFLNVVILRLKAAESIVFGSSHCPQCQTKLKWYDLIPLFSFIILRGRCRNCQQLISFQYPIVESLTALFFGISYYVYGLSYLSGLAAIVLSLLLIIVVYDLKELMIPEVISWLLLGAALVGKIILDYNHFGSIILGGLIAGGLIALLVLISKGKWMGDGDIKIAAAAGLFLGFPVAVFSIFASFILGAAIGVVLLVAKIKSVKDQVPFTPFLLLGLLVAILWGQQIVDWYLGRFIL